MNHKNANSIKLLHTLLDIEVNLKTSLEEIIVEQSQQKEVLPNTELEKWLSSWSEHDLALTQLSNEYTLKDLLIETRKALNKIIETNQLKAYYDYQVKSASTQAELTVIKTDRNYPMIFFILLLLSNIGLLALLIFRN